MMETKDIYTAAGGVTGGNMETKSVPGYTPAPVVNPDFVEPETGSEETTAETADAADSAKGTTSKTASKTTTSK